jgi:enoyl-CoA hydratase/carnithine racemase
VGAINGAAAGAGAVIALACDFRVMSATAKIAFLFVKVGLAGADMGAAWLLPQVVGLGRATEILMLGDPIPAQRALEIGLVHKLAPSESVLAEAQALAQRLAAGPRFAIGMTKEMLNREPGMSLEEALEAEAQAQQICMDTRDFREAYEAFVQKREPKFEGK